MKERKPKTCRICSDSFIPYRSTQVVCSTKCAVILGKQKEAKKERIAWKKANDLKGNKDALQMWVNKIVRLIDNGQPCLAKDYHPNQIHAGHIFSRGSTPELRYNLHNIHRQSAQSNHFQNEEGLLREGLRKEYGVDYFDFISGLRSFPTEKHSALTYAGFIVQARKIYNRLKKEIEKPLSKTERIQYRNEVNMELGIYSPECWYFTLLL